jgi:hypothetical protein
VEDDKGNVVEFSPLAAVEQDLADLRRGAHRSNQLRMGLLSLMGLAVVVLLLLLAGINQLFSMPGPFSRVRFYYPYTIQAGDTLESIAKKAGIEVSDIWANQGEIFTKPPAPGVILWLPSLKPSLWQRLFPRRAVSSPEPLTLNSIPAEIKQRILDSPRYWQTLWAEQVTMWYGVPGYIAPPNQVDSQQICISQPGQGLLLRGNVADPFVTNAIYFDGIRAYETDKNIPNHISTYFLRDTNVTGSVQSPPEMPFMPRFSNKDWQVKLVGMEVVAGRNAMVVDQYHADGHREARLWVDTRLGVILAERWYADSYNGTEHQPVLMDRVVLTIQFGVKIPDSMLDPNNHLAKFVKNVKGNSLETPNLARPAALLFGPDPASIDINHISPPDGFNPNQSRLTLRLQPLPVDYPFNAESLVSGIVNQIRMMDVFADDYYLGTINLHSTGRVYLDFCSRSPDGSLVLFNRRTADNDIVNWFRLSDPQTVHNLPGMQRSSGLYAFSPSSSQLAYYHCGLDISRCGIELVDFKTGKINRFLETPEQNVYWLGYSPDGGSLAVIFYSINGSLLSPTSNLKIYDLSNAKNTYFAAFNIETGKAAPGAPTQAWGTAFQPLVISPAGCDLP